MACSAKIFWPVQTTLQASFLTKAQSQRIAIKECSETYLLHPDVAMKGLDATGQKLRVKIVVKNQQ
jgi:hypothetical protein